MALQLVISQSFDTTDDLLLAVEHIVGLIEAGNTSGYYPHWTLVGEEIDRDERDEAEDERDHEPIE